MVLLISPNLSSAQSDVSTDLETDKAISELIDSILSPSAHMYGADLPGVQMNFTDQSGVVVRLSDSTLSNTESTNENEKIRIALNDSSAVNLATPTTKNGTKLTPAEIHRQAQTQRCLSMYYRMPVNTEDWRPWTIMHGLLPYGKQSQVIHKGKHYNAVEYLCHNAIGNDTYMLNTNNGSMNVSVGPGVQGHEGQFLAMLAQSDVPRDQKIFIFGNEFTVEDLIEHEKQGCRQATELTFKLIGLSHYVDSDEVWTNSIGQSWNIERLIFEELKQPINGAACGGTHRLMGLSYGVRQREKQGQPIDGQWARANNFIKEYQEYAMRYQNHDGSFSTNWFVTQEADSDLKKRLYTTGHIVEWLAFSLDEEGLADQRFQKSLDYLLKLMLTAPSLDLEIGPKGHALHALRIFELRQYGSNSDVEDATPQDIKIVKQALIQQDRMKPKFDSDFGNTRAQGVSFPGGNTGRRMFRRR